MKLHCINLERHLLSFLYSANLLSSPKCCPRVKPSSHIQPSDFFPFFFFKCFPSGCLRLVGDRFTSLSSASEADEAPSKTTSSGTMSFKRFVARGDLMKPSSTLIPGLYTEHCRT